MRVLALFVTAPVGMRHLVFDFRWHNVRWIESPESTP